MCALYAYAEICSHYDAGARVSMYAQYTFARHFCANAILRWLGIIKSLRSECLKHPWWVSKKYFFRLETGSIISLFEIFEIWIDAKIVYIGRVLNQLRVLMWIHNIMSWHHEGLAKILTETSRLVLPSSVVVIDQIVVVVRETIFILLVCIVCKTIHSCVNVSQCTAWI